MPVFPCYQLADSMVFGILKFDIPAAFCFARLTQCRGCSQQTMSPHHPGDMQQHMAWGEYKKTLRGAKSLTVAGNGAKFLKSTQPRARQGPVSPELSLSHAWKQPLQKLQRQLMGMQAEHISPLAGNR